MRERHKFDDEFGRRCPPVPDDGFSRRYHVDWSGSSILPGPP